MPTPESTLISPDTMPPVMPPVITPVVPPATSPLTLSATSPATPDRDWFGPIYRRGVCVRHGRPPRIALTFDDGPTAGGTERVLALLARHGVTAAFFVIGQNARRWPGLIERVASAGHVVGNHSWSHAWFAAGRHQPWWEGELRRTGDAIAATIGRRPALWRPPLGVRTPFNMAAAAACGLKTILWTRRSMDGVRLPPAAIERRLLGPKGAADGGILVMHDGAEPGRRRDVRPMVAALGRVLPTLRDRGFEFVSLPTLLGLPAYSNDTA